MAREINLTSNEWCNIIFEGKNKEYGAYALRQESSKRHFTAFGMVVLFTLVMILLPRLSNALGINKGDVGYSDSIMITEFNSPKPDVPKENIEKVKEPVEKVLLKNSIKFTTPKIVEDNKVDPADEIVSQDALTNNDDAIASATVTNGDERGVSIDDLDRNQVLVQDETPVETTFDIVEIMPQFPGDEGELNKYLGKNIKYPTIAQENNIEGRVVVQFVVGRDGSIEDAQIAKSVDRSLDAEALRVVKSMPRWIPGKQGGRAVKVKYYVPVNFKLNR